MGSTLAATAPGIPGRPAWYRDRFALGVAGAFCLLNVLTVANHAMWRDEWGVFLTGRYVTSWAELIAEVRRNGHPLFWFLCSWLLNSLPGYPWPLKILHILMSTGAVFLMTRWMPLTRWQRVLLAFGYFPLYEYGTILRNYAPALLAMVIAAVVFTLPRRRPVLFGVVLAAAAQVSLFNVAIGLPLAVAYGFDTWRSVRKAGGKMPASGLILGGAIALAGMVLTALEVRPPVDLSITHTPFLGETPEWLRHAASSVWRGYVPFRLIGLWNINFLDMFPRVQVFLSYAILACVSLFLARRPTALLFYLLGTAGVILLCAYLGEASHARHHGQTFVVFLLSLWLAGRTDESEGPPFLRRWTPRTWARWQGMFVTAILGLQVLAAALAVFDEQVQPFSGSAKAAEIIRRQSPPDLPIIADTDYAASSVAGCLDRPIFIACRGEYATFLKQDVRRSLDPLPEDELFQRVKEFQRTQQRDVLLVVNYSIQSPETAPMLLGIAHPAIVTDERFEVYRIPYVAAP